MLLHFGCLLGYEGPGNLIFSNNLASALIDPTVIDKKLAADLVSGRVIELVPHHPFIASPP